MGENNTKKVSLKDKFVHEIENNILSGQWSIGSRLPTERELSEDYEVSRVVVRSGLAELAGKGFVTIQPRHGVFVADFREKGKIETLISIFTSNGDILSKNEVRSIIEIRLSLEKLAVENVVREATDEELQSLKPLLLAMKESSTPRECADAAYNFHHALNILSRNSILPLFYASSRNAISGLWERYSRKYGNKALYENASKLYNLICSREKEKAISWCEEYVGASIHGALEIYSDEKK